MYDTELLYDFPTDNLFGALDGLDALESEEVRGACLIEER